MMLTVPVSLRVWSLFSLWIHTMNSNAAQLWTYPMTTSNGVSEWFYPDAPNIITSNTECPGSTTACWSLSTGSTIGHTSSTSNYHHMELTYSIATAAGGGNRDNCVIDYSVDGTNFYTITDTGTSSTDTTNNIYNSWGTAPDDVSTLTIRARYIGTGSKLTCYLNQFTLNGVDITTSPTAAPTSTPSTPPTDSPSASPSSAPSQPPSMASAAPSNAPTQPPSMPSNAPSAWTQSPTLSPSTPSLSPTSSPICTSTGHWTQWYECTSCISDLVRYGQQQYATLQLTSCISAYWVNKVCIASSGYGIVGVGVGWKNGEDSVRYGDSGDWSYSCKDLDSPWSNRLNVDCFDKVRVFHKYGKFTAGLQFGTSAGEWASKVGNFADDTMTTVTGNAGECIKAVQVGTVSEGSSGYRLVNRLKFFFESAVRTRSPTQYPTTATPTVSTTNPTTRIPSASPTLNPTSITRSPSSAPTSKPTIALLSTFCANYGAYTDADKYGPRFVAISDGFCCRRSYKTGCDSRCAIRLCEEYTALGNGSYYDTSRSGVLYYTCCVPTPAPTVFPTAAPIMPTTATPTVQPTTATPTFPTSNPTTSDPTSPPTLTPTLNPTHNPTTEIPSTSKPTMVSTPQPSSTPTLKPTYYSPDASDSNLFFMTIIGNYMTNVVLMTRSDNYTDLVLYDVLESPLEKSSIGAITELSENSDCDHGKCIKFWQIDYAETCGVLLDGDWKVQFSVMCHGAYVEQRSCFAALDVHELSNNKYISLTVSNFQFEDAICDDASYSKVFVP
eukprot:267656_1